MVFYIRFLKPPKVFAQQLKGHSTTLTVKALVTITTDLGDDFFPEDALIEVRLESLLGKPDYQTLKASTINWSRRARVLSIEIHVKCPDHAHQVQLHLAESNAVKTESISPLNPVPRIVHVRSDFFRLDSANDTEDVALTSRSERRFSMLNGHSQLAIWEDTANSIARHIWDAGISLVAFLEDLHKKPPRDEVSTLLNPLLFSRRKEPVHVLELGSGCGIVGIGIVQLFPNCKVHLTDLPEAMDILDFNISRAKPAERSKITKSTLDWSEEIHAPIASQQYNLIVVSDCTYSSDSLPDLVNTLRSLKSASEDGYILVGLKERHASEAIFFNLMQDAGMDIMGHVSVANDTHPNINAESKRIDIYLFRYKS